jgi:cytochrome b561
MLKDSPSGYGLVTILFHWVCAPLIIFLFGLGVYMRSLDYYSPWYHRAPALHISLGLAVLLLMSLRAIWRSRSTSPAPIPTISASQYLAANIVKIALYIFVFLICISGYFITTAEGQAASFFDLFGIPPSIELSADNVDRAGKIHKYLAWGIIGIVILHAGAALFHHFIKRDRTLLRMLKPASPSNPISPSNPMSPSKKTD